MLFQFKLLLEKEETVASFGDVRTPSYSKKYRKYGETKGFICETVETQESSE